MFDPLHHRVEDRQVWTQEGGEAPAEKESLISHQGCTFKTWGKEYIWSTQV